MILVTLASIVLIGWMLVDAFETVLVPRRVVRRFQFARFYYRMLWPVFRAVGVLVPPGKRREAMLSWFGPMSLIGLFTIWALGLIVGFALLHWSLGTPLRPPEEQRGFMTYLYLSGVTFFTLGYGDVTPSAPVGRMLAVLETGIGFGFLAAMIGYLPVLYQAFSRRESTIGLLDARAGSPPTAAQFLPFACSPQAGNMRAAVPLLAEWERWSAELLESHLSFPSPQLLSLGSDNQSWLASALVAAILDAPCSWLLVGAASAEAKPIRPSSPLRWPGMRQSI